MGEEVADIRRVAAQLVELERLGQDGPRVVVEKSPENVATDAALKRLASAYPRARYLHLTRHPITTQRSMVEHWNRIVPGYPMQGQPMTENHFVSGIAV